MRRSDFASSDDLRAMQDMCSRLWSPTSRFHPGQLAWNWHARPGDGTAAMLDDSISLWRDGTRVVGFGWAEAPDWLELQIDPSYPEVANEVVEWFEEWSDAPTQSVHVMADDPSEPALLEAGFVAHPRAWHFTHLLRDLSDLPEVPSVPGYRLRQLAGPAEAEARASCHVAAWRDVGASPVTGPSYAALMGTWPYRPDLDWVAVRGNGDMVASCLVWFDPSTGVGLVEPVGCVPEHRGRGLASAVVLAALARLREVGGRRAVVSARGDDDHPGPRRLYESLGFRGAGRTVTWTRSIA